VGGSFFYIFFVEVIFFDFSISKDPWYLIIIGKLFIAFLTIGTFKWGLEIIFNKLTMYKQIKWIEKIYDKQGGFLWSNQQY